MSKFVHFYHSLSSFNAKEINQQIFWITHTSHQVFKTFYHLFLRTFQMNSSQEQPFLPQGFPIYHLHPLHPSYEFYCFDLYHCLTHKEGVWQHTTHSPTFTLHCIVHILKINGNFTYPPWTLATFADTPLTFKTSHLGGVRQPPVHSPKATFHEEMHCVVGVRVQTAQKVGSFEIFLLSFFIFTPFTHNTH